MTTHSTNAFITGKSVGDLVKELKPQPDLVDVPSTETLETVFDILLANDILSVPVYKDGSHPKIYLGFVSALGLVQLIVDKKTVENLQSQNDFLLQPISTVLERVSAGQETSVKATDPLSALLDRLSHDHLHRVLVWSDNQEEPVVISQRDILRYFHSHNHELGKILDCPATHLTMAALGDKPAAVQSIHLRHTAWEAFSRIASLSPLSAIAVVDDAGVLVTAISAGDLRGLNRNRIPDLSRPIITFLKSTHGDDGILPLTCHSRFTLQQIIAALVLGQAHRIWLCDADDRVEGVVTLTDVLTAFSNEAKGTLTQ